MKGRRHLPDPDIESRPPAQSILIPIPIQEDGDNNAGKMQYDAGGHAQ
jgi:hypothetical protein